jgi:amino acid transporter
MVSKDQAIGGVICVACAFIALFYLITLAFPWWLSVFGAQTTDDAQFAIRFWLIAIPVIIAFIAILAIGAWIGWTMATTPPPKPIEDLTPPAEEKKEELVTEKKEETQAPEPTPPAEEKRPERKKKSEKQ